MPSRASKKEKDGWVMLAAPTITVKAEAKPATTAYLQATLKHPLKYASLPDLSSTKEEIAALVASLEATEAYNKAVKDLSEIDLLPMPNDQDRNQLQQAVTTARRRAKLASKFHARTLRKVEDDKEELATIEQAKLAAPIEALQMLKPYSFAAIPDGDKNADLGLDAPPAPTSRRGLSSNRFA